MDPFLAVSNQVIAVAESVTNFAIAALASLPQNSGASAVTKMDEDPIGSEAEALHSTATIIPPIPVAPELHMVPLGPAEVFLWFHLPPPPAGQTFALREISADTGEVTRCLTIEVEQASAYLEIPQQSGLHCLEIGYSTGNAWTRCSSVVTLRGRARPEAAPAPLSPSGSPRA